MHIFLIQSIDGASRMINKYKKYVKIRKWSQWCSSITLRYRYFHPFCIVVILWCSIYEHREENFLVAHSILVVCWVSISFLLWFYSHNMLTLHWFNKLWILDTNSVSCKIFGWIESDFYENVKCWWNISTN